MTDRLFEERCDLVVDLGERGSEGLLRGGTGRFDGFHGVTGGFLRRGDEAVKRFVEFRQVSAVGRFDRGKVRGSLADSSERSFEALRFVGAQGVDFLGECFVFSDGDFVKLGFEVVDFILNLVRKLFAKFERTRGAFGDAVQARGGDTDLFGGGGGDLGERGDFTLALGER